MGKFGKIKKPTISKVICSVEHHERRRGVYSLYDIELQDYKGNKISNIDVSLDFPFEDNINAPHYLWDSKVKLNIKKSCFKIVNKKFPEIKNIKKFVVRVLTTPDGD